MKKINLPITIVDSVLNCPHCAGDLQLVGAIALGESITPTFSCYDCQKVVGMNFGECKDGHMHIGWVDVTGAGSEFQDTPPEEHDEMMN
jgi:hypothetical protein